MKYPYCNLCDLTHAEDLPQHNAVRPDVALLCRRFVLEHFWGGPFSGNSRLQHLIKYWPAPCIDEWLFYNLRFFTTRAFYFCVLGTSPMLEERSGCTVPQGRGEDGGWVGVSVAQSIKRPV